MELIMIGNTPRSIFSILILFDSLDVESPVIKGLPSAIIVDADPNTDNTVVSWAEATVTDNSGQVTLTSTHNSPSEFVVGTTTVTFIATDAYGNVAQASFDVIVTG